MNEPQPEFSALRTRAALGTSARALLLFGAMALLLVVLIAITGQALVLAPAAQATEREAQSRAREQLLGIELQLERTQSLAGAVADVLAGRESGDATTNLSEQLARSGLGTLVAGLGWWPEPQADGARASRFWLADGRGTLRPRPDYNDPRVVPYWRESWYAPARDAAPGRCYWTPLGLELLSRRMVLGCTMPQWQGERFAGAITVLLDAERLEHTLRAQADGDSGYALLVDRDNRLIASIGDATLRLNAARPRNLAELAQRYPEFNDLALRLHQQDEAYRQRAQQSDAYDAQRIDELAEESRDSTRLEAESALASLWNAPRGDASATPAALEFSWADDPLLGEAAGAQVFTLPRTQWKLLHVHGRSQVTSIALLTGLALAVALALAALYALLRATLLQPLRRIAARLALQPADIDSPALLGVRTGGDLGTLAQAYDARALQVQMLAERLRATPPLATSAERTRMDEQLQRLRERHRGLMQASTDAVFVVDAQGRIEDCNPVAEGLLAQSLREMRGQPLARLAPLHDLGRHDASIDYIARLLDSSESLDLAPLRLAAANQPVRDLHLLGLPLGGASGTRATGALLILSALQAPETPVAPAVVTADDSAWLRRIRAGLDGGHFHLLTQRLAAGAALATEGEAYEISFALEDEEGFWAQPAAFMAAAQRGGLAAEIELWALAQTLDALGQSDALRARLAFCLLPLSVASLTDPRTLDQLARGLQSHPQVSTASLCFALHDDALLQAPQAVQRFCEALHTLGCRVALNPFFARAPQASELLRRLPAEFLHVDAASFPALAESLVDRTLAESAARLSRALQRRLIVSGVQDESTRKLWLHLGADYLGGGAVERRSPQVFATPA